MPKSVLDDDYSYGKNNKHYVHTGLSLFTGVSATELPNLQFRAQNSTAFYFFVLYKRKLNNIFSFTSELNIGSSWIQYRFTGDSPQYPTIFSTHVRDVLTIGELEVHQNIRFRVSGGPNRIGNYVEVGVLGGVATSRRYTHKGTSLNNQRTELSIIHDPVILTDGNRYGLDLFYYGFKGRLGFERISIPVRYVINGDFWWVMAGVEIGLF
ncbi:MAG: hypothetical protein ACK4KT_10150 [Thermaurantimonas sp.]